MLGKFCGSDLENCSYIHPLENREFPVVVGGDYITMESRTGLVHTAPCHGQEDFLISMKYKLLVSSPIDDNGKFTKESGEFASLDVLGDENVAIVKILDEHSCLLMEEVYKH